MLPIFKQSWPGLMDELLNVETIPNFIEAVNYQKAAVNIQETKEDFRIEVVAPGLGKNDLNVNLDQHVLTVSSVKELNNDDNRGKYLRKEFNYSSFKRSFTLPETADTEKISAEHVNGILYLTIPKKEEAKVKPARLISIN